ncbi:MAG TPA: anti-sigma factor [Verrucomicrobiae bacterium]|nr:anti-sigma factor [Verrucomicrobiae bacterium]
MTDARDPVEHAADAGEYVLGTLGAEERAAFERAASADPQLRAEQHRWEARLGTLGARLQPVPPRPIVWLNLMQRISGGGASGSQMAPRATPAGRGVRAWAALATAASLVLGFGLYREMSRPAPEPTLERVEVLVPAQTFVAYLQVPKSTMFWTVAAVPGQNEIAIRAGGEPPAAAKDLDAELWLIAKGGNPISLGVIPKTGDVRRKLPSGLPMSEGGIVAVSLEPKGGSPTGQPTGPVVTTAPVMQAS